MAGLASRIREGKDDDLAHALPALIPIPKAFDGDSKLQSYTADNIVYDIKKKLILSEMGYISQKTVPLYVRNTLEEKEGTSLQGDPTKEELAQDRRYSHYLGRPIVRFNPSVSSVHVRSPEGKGDTSSTASTPEPFIAADPFSLSTLTFPPSHKMEREKQDKLLLKELRKAQEEVRHLPITSSLVRMVFKNPEPTLEDLKYLDEIF
ncbi:hypothetical protein EON65_31540 [archaeon]|nr:MAG: hypothetical protein EON65_31540 [archaeon]